MWRDRILEAKNARGTTTKYMAEFSNMTEKTVDRILSGETQNPYVGNVIVLGASVGLSPSEIFSETGLVVGDQNLAILQAEVDRLTAELEALTGETAALRSVLTALTTERDLLQLKLEHKEELVKHKDEILTLLRQRDYKN
jgi:transcriptional regulator with XRE-family HTH domain